MSPARAADAARVTFLVEAPASTPAGSRLWISGDAPQLGSWDGAGVPLAPTGDGRHAATVNLARGEPVAFKVTRGSWATVEKDRQGGEIANRTHRVAGDDTIRVVVASWRDQVEAPARPTLTGDIRRHPAFGSVHVRPRDVLVYLPPGYEADTLRRHPVLYFHDGQNVFDAATSFIGVEWGADETAERLIRSGDVAPFIVVAVANSPDRMSDYTPALDDGRGGHASDYARFLIDELKPFVDATYRTDTEPARTGVIGSSLGGLASMYLGLEHPDVFGLIGCVSPTVWWGGRDILRRAASAPPGLRIWLDMGTEEGRARTDRLGSLEGARALRDALKRRGYREGADLHYGEFEGAGHDERAWAARLEPLMRFLLSEAGR